MSATPIVAMDWYNGLYGFVEPEVPCFAIAFNSGRIVIMRNEQDQKPIVIDSGLDKLCLKWSPNGSILAIGGVQVNSSGASGEDSLIVSFFDPRGRHLRSLRVPGKDLHSVSWEHKSLRVALAVDSSVYFASMRPDYKWAYFGGMEQGAYSLDQGCIAFEFGRPSKNEWFVNFWNTRTNESHIKPFQRVIHISAAGDRSVVACRTGDACQLMVCNSLGTILDTKTIEIEPLMMSMNNTHVICIGQDGSTILIWQHRNLVESNISGSIKVSDALDLARQSKQKERWFHIDDIANTVGSPQSASYSHTEIKTRKWVYSSKPD